MTDRWCIVRDGVVENVVAWNGDLAVWQPPNGAKMVRATDDAEQGSLWDGVSFSLPTRVCAPSLPSKPDAIDVLLGKLVASKVLSASDAEDVMAVKNG